MAINLTDSLNAATTKGKLGDAKQVYLNGDTKNLQQAYEETSTHFGTLDNRSTQIEKAIQDISVTGGASTANAVSYNNSTSKLEAITAQGAFDELATKNATKAEKVEVIAELEKKFDKESILQESGDSEDKVMSQKAVSDKLSDLLEHIDASIENSLSNTFNNISIDGNTLTIKKEGFSLFVLGKRIAFEGTEDKVFNSDNSTIRKSVYINMKYIIETSNLSVVNFTENEDVFIEKINSTYNGLLFAEWYLGKLMHTGLIAIFKTNKQIADTNKQMLDTNKIQIYCADGNIPYIEETGVDSVYVYFRGNIVVRAFDNKTITQTELLTELGVEGEISPKGIQNCLKITDEQVFVYDMSDFTFKLVNRYAVVKEQIKLISVIFGSVNISECRYFLAQWYADRISKVETNIQKDFFINNGLIRSLNGSNNVTLNLDGSITINKNGFSLFIKGKLYHIVGNTDKTFSPVFISGKSKSLYYIDTAKLKENEEVNWDEVEGLFYESGYPQDMVLLFGWYYTSKYPQPIGLFANGINMLLSEMQMEQLSNTNNQLFNFNRIQLYLSDKCIPYIEEDRTNGKVYVYLVGNICVRVYGSGRTIRQQALAEEMGVELTTSPLGKENCFVIDDEYDFVFDLSDGKFKIISRYNVKVNHVVLIVNMGGSVNISESKNFLAQWYNNRINEAEKNIEDFKSYVDKGKNIRIRNNVALNSDFKAIFFSDVHGASENVRRIKEKAISWKSQYVDCILNGGDTVQNFNSEGLDWYNQLVQDSAIPFISAVGNHDAWSTNYWIWDSNENIYNLLTSKVKEYVPSIVQPTDVNTTHANYYYYDTEKVRVIVLLSLTFTSSDVYYDEAQDTWLKSVLADAKENNKAVIIMNHGPIDPKDSEEMECNWTSKISWTNDVQDYQHMDNRILENVDYFIDSGGKFICYLAGHTHLDYILRSKKYPRQMCIVIKSARYNYGDDCIQSQSKDNMDYDSYNYIGVDLTHSVIKVQRIGMNTNAWMQEHNTMCWDFKNSKLISEN